MKALPMPIITVCIVEDEPETLRRLRHALAAAAGLEVAYCAMSCKMAVDWLAVNAVDVLLVDLGLPDGSGLDVIRFCRTSAPATEVMVITMFGDEVNMIEAFEAGARGYLLKDGTVDDLAQHVKNLHAGGSPMTPAIARQMLNRFSQVAAQDPQVRHAAIAQTGVSLLSEREQDILSKLAKGYTYGEVAKLLGLSLSAIQFHVKNLYSKLAVNSKTEAIFEARQLGLL